MTLGAEQTENTELDSANIATSQVWVDFGTSQPRLFVVKLFFWLRTQGIKSWNYSLQQTNSFYGTGHNVVQIKKKKLLSKSLFLSVLVDSFQCIYTVYIYVLSRVHH